jgi:hypothetical protein
MKQKKREMLIKHFKTHKEREIQIEKLIDSGERETERERQRDRERQRQSKEKKKYIFISKDW